VQQNTIERQKEARHETMEVLEDIVREGARRLLQAALEAEIDAHLARYQDRKDEAGKRLVVMNGYQPARTILTGAGPLSVIRPRQVSIRLFLRSISRESRRMTFQPRWKRFWGHMRKGVSSV